jgi:transglutaminase-like putative cysteine protease
MRLSAGCHLSLETTVPTPAILMLRPRSGYGQWVTSEKYDLQPNILVVEYTDTFGNLCQRLVVPPGKFEVETFTIADTADEIDVHPEALYIPVENLPDETIRFLLPSRYCQSDQIYELAQTIVGQETPGYKQVEAIRQWIHDKVEYAYGTSDASTSAVDTADKRVGVCRDFAHLGIALCRSLNIPARMAVGYLYQLEPMDLHAWFEVYLNEPLSKTVGDRNPTSSGRWYIFDPTQVQPRGNRITIAYGRDAADVALLTQFGPMQLNSMQVWVKAAEASP